MVFSGIVRAVLEGKWDPAQQLLTFSIQGDNAGFWSGLELGESVAVNGVCLTVMRMEHGTVSFFLQKETLERTTFGLQRAGDSSLRANLERSLRQGERNGGHEVQGHVHGVATVSKVAQHSDGSRKITFVTSVRVPAGIPEPRLKGSVALHGVSLTIAGVEGRPDGALSFSVCCIPFTLQHTNLHVLAVGDAVNLEYAGYGRGGLSGDVAGGCGADTDVRYMREALELARRGLKTCAPNPPVGCVLVSADGSEVLGRGYHQRAGEAHAEAAAVQDAGEQSLEGATAYVTLEPCVTFPGKRTPACSELLAKHKVARVVVGILDPHAKVRGSGVAALRASGAHVVLHCLRGEARQLLQDSGYHGPMHFGFTRRPAVTLKAASSVDNFFTTGEDNQWLTSSALRAHSHRHLRATHDAILVGSGTAMADAPSLTVRHGVDGEVEGNGQKQPLRVLLDRRGEVPPTGPLFDMAQASLLVLTSAEGQSRRGDSWRAAGAEVQVLRGEGGVRQVLHELGARGIRSVLVEGGLKVQAAFVRARCVDRFVRYVGGGALGAACPGANWALPAGRWVCRGAEVVDGKGAVLTWEPAAEELGELRAAEAAVDEAISALSLGEPVVVPDEVTRENEADLVMAAHSLAAEDVAFLTTYTSGILCAPMEPARAVALGLPPMVDPPADPMATAFTVSCDAVGTGTGVSAAARAATFRALADPHTGPKDLVRPGHVFPLCARHGGLHERGGHTEATVDLLRLAGLMASPVGAIGELQDAPVGGAMLQSDEAPSFARRHGLAVVSTAQLRLVTPRAPQASVLGAPCRLPLTSGFFVSRVWQDEDEGAGGVGSELVSLELGNPGNGALVRVHSCCFTSEVLGSRRCDCRQQLDEALARISAEGSGVLVYDRSHEGRGIGLGPKFSAYALMEADASIDTYEANRRLGLRHEARSFAPSARVLRKLGVTRMRLLTNNPYKANALRAEGLEVFEVVPLHAEQPHAEAQSYLAAKHAIGNHSIPLSLISSSLDGGTTQKGYGKSRHMPEGHMPQGPEASELADLKMTVVRTAWNHAHVDLLTSSVVARWKERGGVREPRIVRVAGAWELPLQAKREAAKCDVVIAIGVLVKGETMHFEYISEACTQGLMKVSLDTGVPVINGVLNVLSDDQATARSDPASGIAESWTDTAISMLDK